MSALSATEKQQVYQSLWKLGLLAAQRLAGSRQSVKTEVLNRRAHNIRGQRDVDRRY
jgi:hypothetical protein